MCKSNETANALPQQTQLQLAYHFPCTIYLIERPDFLDTVSAVSEEYLAIKREQPINDIYPALMSDSYANDLRLQEFTEFVGSTAWNILSGQGYAMHEFEVMFTEMWTQEHHKHSGMEQHVHGYGAQIVGFYFLEVPDNSSRVVFHDPRSGKVQIDLPETDVTRASFASKMINFVPTPGLLMFTNAWLAHSFTRHASDQPIKFVHFNLAVRHVASSTSTCTSVEVI